MREITWDIGAGRRRKLTADIQARICAHIRGGAYDYAAAEACGISRRTFFDWMQRGEGTSQRRQSTLFVQFVRAVREAQAECRVSAEVEVRRADPKWWLSRMHRDRPGSPGWSDAPPEQISVASGLHIHIDLGEDALAPED